jgi:hypothetical protein
LTIVIVYQNSIINSKERISKAANFLIENKKFEFTNEGFILASLAFLEQNRKEYPDIYEISKEIFKNYNKSEHRALNAVTVSYEMSGLIK